MAELPSGTVTFLFTDLEVSTRLWERQPDAMTAALARHDVILREAVAAHGGHVVKGTGDGIHAAFATADAAVRAATEAQLAVGSEHWAVGEPLRVRMGIHTGVAELREGDYFGSSVNRAARLMAAAHGGQVVVSQAAADLARDTLGEDVELVDLGEHRLRDLSRAVRVYQVAADGLEREFSRLRTLDAFPGNLPAQFTSFIGRIDEIATVAAALEGARVITLTGVGGVGKTRLAIQTAAEVLPDYRDGAWLCELAAAGDPDAMVQVVAAALGVQSYPGVPLEARVREVLRERRVLLVLDNCEHLLNAVSQLAAAIMLECRHARVLATSREPLDIAGERVVRVRSLRVRDPAVNVEVGDESDAVRLFVERAISAEPDFVLDKANARTVEEVCRRLDGIPLAIELAAARVVAMTPAEILGLLDERFRLLTGGRRTAVERHQTLRATVDWSFSLLDPIERLVFTRLGVFPASFDAAAAREVAGGEGVETWDVLDALTSLVSKSMVNTVASEAGATRYQSLETMRQYARERLDEAGDADRCRRAHAAHYEAILADHAVAMDTGLELARNVDAVRLELDNLRAAVTWSLDSDAPGDIDVALRIAGALAGVGPTDRRAAGLIAHADRLLERADSSSPELRAGLLAGMASDVLFLRGDPVAAEDLARRALADGPANTTALVIAYSVLALCAAIAGDYERQLEMLADGELASSALRGRTAHNRAFFEIQIAGAEVRRGNVTAARRHATDAVRLAREAEYPMRLTQTLNVWADLTRHDDPAAAEAALAEAEELAPEALPAAERGRTLLLRAQVRVQRADVRGAVESLQRALIVWDGDIPAFYVAIAAPRAALILAAADQPRPAAVLAGAATAGPHAQLSTIAEPRARQEFDDTVKHLRTTLGPDDYSTEATRGAAMSSDDLLRFLRQAADDALALSHD